MLKSLSILLGVALIVMLGFLLDAQSQTPVAPRVEAPIATKIFAPGRVEGQTEEIELRPQIHGQIVTLAVREGDIVKLGDVLVQLDPREYEHDIALAQAELSLAQAERERIKNGARTFEREEALALHRAKLAEYELAQLGFQRTQRLRSESAISQQEADDQRSKMRSLEAQVQAAKARAEHLDAPAREDELNIASAKIDAAQSRLDLARFMLERATLKAVTPGQVLKINVEPGELTGPASLEPTLVIADTSHYRVRAFVEELDAPRVRVGQIATIV
ncbi:MAG TPA: biotin/lipoyl-binding protein, partial [Pirellulaceae bacterium]|nr:biotin/lipoyl-binding protein [Pirellulaceae bacterium]